MVNFSAMLVYSPSRGVLLNKKMEIFVYSIHSLNNAALLNSDVPDVYKMTYYIITMNCIIVCPKLCIKEIDHTISSLLHLV